MPCRFRAQSLETRSRRTSSRSFTSCAGISMRRWHDLDCASSDRTMGDGTHPRRALVAWSETFPHRELRPTDAVRSSRGHGQISRSASLSWTGDAVDHACRFRARRRFRAVSRNFRRNVPHRLQRALPDPDCLQQRAEGGISPHPRDLVRRTYGACGCDGFHAVVFSGDRKRCDRFRNDRTRTSRVLRSLGPSRSDLVVKIGFPRSLPYFFASLKIAITLAFVGSVIAEIVAGNAGIGNVMLVASSSFTVPLVFAALIVVGMMGIGMYAIFAALERRFTSWSVRGLGGIEQAAGG